MTKDGSYSLFRSFLLGQKARFGWRKFAMWSNVSCMSFNALCTHKSSECLKSQRWTYENKCLHITTWIRQNFSCHPQAWKYRFIYSAGQEGFVSILLVIFITRHQNYQVFILLLTYCTFSLPFSIGLWVLILGIIATVSLLSNLSPSAFELVSV